MNVGQSSACYYQFQKCWMFCDMFYYVSENFVSWWKINVAARCISWNREHWINTSCLVSASHYVICATLIAWFSVVGSLKSSVKSSAVMLTLHSLLFEVSQWIHPPIMQISHSYSKLQLTKQRNPVLRIAYSVWSVNISWPSIILICLWHRAIHPRP